MNKAAIVVGIFNALTSAALTSACLTCGTADARSISADTGDFFQESPLSAPFYTSGSASIEISVNNSVLNNGTTLTYNMTFIPGTGAQPSAGVINTDAIDNFNSSSVCSNGPDTDYTNPTGDYPQTPNICWAYMINWGSNPTSVAGTAQVMIYVFADGQSNIWPGQPAGRLTAGAIEVDFNYPQASCPSVTASFTVNGKKYTSKNPCLNTNAFFFNIKSQGTGLTLKGGVPSGWTAAG